MDKKEAIGHLVSDLVIAVLWDKDTKEAHTECGEHEIWVWKEENGEVHCRIRNKVLCR